MIFQAFGESNFGLVRTLDGFDSVLDKKQTLQMVLKYLEYAPDKQPIGIRIVTADDEKYEIEPVAPGDNMEEKICNIAIE